MAQERLAQELHKAIKGEVRFDSYSRVLYSTDASIYQMEPMGVVIPKDSEDVVAAIEIAYGHGVAVFPRGAGTSLAGQAVNHAIALDLSKYMNRLLEVNPQERWAGVQPGITIDELNRQMRPYSLMFAPDPTTQNRATVGGAIGNNSCGSHSAIFGKTQNHIIALKVALSDGSQALFHAMSQAQVNDTKKGKGLEAEIYREVTRVIATNREEILRRFPKIMRRVSGYNLDALIDNPLDLCQLVVGSEGTLAVVIEAQVGLVPLPKHKGLALLHFSSIYEALAASVSLLGERAAAIELVDHNILKQARSHPALSRSMALVQGDPKALLGVELFAESQQELKDRLENVKRRADRDGMGYASVLLEDPHSQADFWRIRSAGLGLAMGMKGDMKPIPFVEDTAVPPERLPEYFRRFDQIVKDNGTTAAYYGHASVGCLHIRPLIDLKLAQGVDRMIRIASEVSDLVVEFGGAMSGEHGDGIVRGVWTEKMFGKEIYLAFKAVKKAFDPKGIMNPGKILDTPPMTENLRIGPGYRTMEVKTHLDFSQDFGLSGSVELCSGLGACRKLSEGTMCPSYMVTREEEHSTRGRANALRAVLSGALPPSQFTSRRLYEALDLCLQCKGCKAECPSSVDMAKLKSEFLAHYHEKNGYPLRSKLFANIAALDRWGCAMAPVSNWAAHSPLARWIGRWIGIDPRRELPPFARPTFERWFRRRPAMKDDNRPKVVFLHDTFTNYSYPQVGIAAVRVLEAMGFQVILPPTSCCGRPMLSKGMLKGAKALARHRVDSLYPYAEQGIKIVGCEPSCLLTLRDEYMNLLPGDAKAKVVAENSLLLEEFILREHERGALQLQFKPLPSKALFHSHCHQKALVGTAPSQKVLGLIPQLEVENLDSGCCGMAGAFGFEREHYDISMAIGERVLFPAVRSLEGKGLVIVTGASCRQQVEQGTGRKAKHLAELLAEAIMEE